MVAQLISKAQALGASFEATRKGVTVRGSKPLPADLMVELRAIKGEIREKVLQGALCQNPLTPHHEHEYYWECRTDVCLCYRKFRYPRICQGAPCRWVWPDGVPHNASDSKSVQENGEA